MVDWQIHTLSRQSSLTGEDFLEGEEVLCLLYATGEGTWERANITPSEWEDFSAKDTLLGKWSRRYTERHNNEDQKQRLLSAEEFFLSLFENEDKSATERDRAILKHFLGLFLERKRILRRIGKAEDGGILYLHVQTKSSYTVPVPAWESELVVDLHRHLDFLA